MMRILSIIMLITAAAAVVDNKMIRTVIWLEIFSLISSLCFLWLAAPDVALAEAVVGTLSTIVYIVAVQKYFGLPDKSPKGAFYNNAKKYFSPLAFTVLLAVLFILFIPADGANTSLKDEYITRFSRDVGGENAVTAIYLGYRMYDTVFEALMLLVSVSAVIHLSWHADKDRR